MAYESQSSQPFRVQGRKNTICGVDIKVLLNKYLRRLLIHFYKLCYDKNQVQIIDRVLNEYSTYFNIQFYNTFKKLLVIFMIRRKRIYICKL